MYSVRVAARMDEGESAGQETLVIAICVTSKDRREVKRTRA